MPDIHPYLSFDNNCKEAMTFYSECLSGELMMQTVGESPMAGDPHAGDPNKIMHSRISKNGKKLQMVSIVFSTGTCYHI